MRLLKSSVRPRPQFKPLSELLADVSVEPDWLWHELLAPGSTTLLAGQPKVGKSTLIYGLLAAIAEGRPFLGRGTKRVRALVLSEEPREAIKAKVARFGGDVHHGISRLDLRTFVWADQIDAATTHAKEHDLGLLVIDTFADLAGLRGDEENDAGAVLAAIDPVKRAAEEGLAVLLVHHQRKAGGRHGAGVRGSSAFVAAVDIVAELDRGGKNTARMLKFESRYSSETRVALELTSGGYVANGNREEEDFVRILAVVDQTGVASTPDIKSAVESHMSRSTVENRLAKMTEIGLIARVETSGSRSDPHLWSRSA